MSRIELNQVPYTNKGHVINPGDRVIASVTGMGRGSIRVGKYLGLYPSGSASVEVSDKENFLVHKDTREVYDYALEQRECPSPYYDANGNYVGYNAAAWKEHGDKVKARKVDYEIEERPYVWRTVLQNNDMFLLDQVAATGSL